MIFFDKININIEVRLKILYNIYNTKKEDLKMYKINDDKRLMNILNEIKENLPKEKTIYKVEEYTFNEYRSRKNLINKRTFDNLDDLMKAFNKSHSKYKKIFVKISNLGYIEITKKLDIKYNIEKAKKEELPFGYTINS